MLRLALVRLRRGWVLLVGFESGRKDWKLRVAVVVGLVDQRDCSLPVALVLVQRDLSLLVVLVLVQRGYLPPQVVRTVVQMDLLLVEQLEMVVRMGWA